jgi:hypothetical protein
VTRRAALAWLLLAVAPARADDGAGIDQLLNFVANGCVPYAVTGASLETFAAKELAKRADEKRAQPFLGADKGVVYLKDETPHPIALAERPGNLCTVHARFPEDLAPILEAADDYFVGPGSRFYPGRVFEETSAHGGWVTHRVYLGERAGKQLTIVLSSDPQAPALEQITVTVAAEKKQAPKELSPQPKPG